MNAIVCVDNDYGIGKNGQLLTHLPEDLAHFKKLTTGKWLIMGRKTVQSLKGGNPLPNRETIVLTRDSDYQIAGGHIKNDKQAVLDLISDRLDSEQVFVCGGAQIYQMFWPQTNRIYLTKILHHFEADVFFPNLDLDDSFALVAQSEVKRHHDLEFIFCEYRRVKPAKKS